MDERYRHVSDIVFRKPWAILPEKLAVIHDLVRMRNAGARFTAEEIQMRIGASAPRRPGARRQRNVAVIPIYGTLMPRANLMTEMSGGTSIQDIQSAYAEALSDPDIGAVVFDVDSPGGVTDLVPETAATIRQNRGKKPTYAVANTLMASAAYWLSAQADEVVASPSALVGSIGVFAAHEDQSAADERDGIRTTLVSAGKYKTEGNPYEPLTDEARTHIQSIVDSAYDQFTMDVARGRRSSVADVRGGYGEGRVLPAKAAVAAGLADRVGTLDQTIRRAYAVLADDSSALAAVDDEMRLVANSIPTEPEAARGGASFADEIEAVLCKAESLVAKGRRLTATKEERLASLHERLGTLLTGDKRTDPQVAAMRNRIRLAQSATRGVPR